MNTSVPSRRCAVVSGSQQQLSTPYGCTRSRNPGQSVSSITLEVMSGCWVCHSNPAGSSALDRSENAIHGV